MSANSAAGITWDLSDLFLSVDDPGIDVTLNHVARAQQHLLMNFARASPIRRSLTPTRWRRPSKSSKTSMNL